MRQWETDLCPDWVRRRDHVKPQRLLLMNFSGVAVVLVTELLLRVLIDQKF